MKTVLYIAYLFIFCSIPLLSQSGQAKKNTKQEVYYDESLGLSVAPCNGEPELLYYPKPHKSVEETAKAERFHYLINGSYFSGSRLLAKPAGWFRLHGRKLGKISKSRQLTHIVRFDSSEKRVHFIPLKRFRTNPESYCEFQSGPLIIEDGEIQEDLIQRSPNGKGNYTRTMLARTAANKLYFITFRHPITLVEAAEALLEIPLFKKGKPSVINLDGGASVSFYSKDYPQHNFNTEDTLPILIGVK